MRQFLLGFMTAALIAAVLYCLLPLDRYAIINNDKGWGFEVDKKTGKVWHITTGGKSPVD